MIHLYKKAVGVATGKIILIGEHSAVYGKPAIAIPCTAVTATTTITPTDQNITIQCALYNGLIDDIPPLLNGIKLVINETLSFLNVENTTLHITIDSNIPLERGMGSSAAISISIIKALFRYFNAQPTPHDLFQLSELSEKMVHGNPSGLDASTIISQEAVLFQKGHAVQPFSFDVGAFLIIADTGITGQTKVAVEKIAQLQQNDTNTHHKLMTQLENLTHQTKLALENKSVTKLGNIFNDAHSVLQQLGVSHDVIDALVSISLNNGALGAKLTGGGLGGCLFALADTYEKANDISTILLQAGSKKTYIQPI